MAALPGWVVDDVTSVRAEVGEWAGLSNAERWKLARLCARDAMWAVNASGVDLERLVAVRPELDRAYVRKWIVQMMGEDDERTLRWDEIVARFGPPGN